MTNAVRLDKVGTVTLNGSGYGFVRLSPQGEKWEVERTRMECSSTTSEAQGRVYVGHIATGRSIDGTLAASTGDTSDTRYYLEDGQAVFYEWTGGTPGATATVTISGWKSQPLGGFRAIH